MSLSCYTYRLSFVNPLKTSSQTFSQRKGLLLVYKDEESELYGEAAPLPGFSRESIEEVKQILTEKKDALEYALTADNVVEKLQEVYTEDSLPASLQFGLDSLAYQIEALKKNAPLLQYLFPDAPERIPVNALISLKSEKVLTEVKRKKSQGFQTFKCKVGLNTKREFRLLKKIRSAFPDLKIRLDANQAWSLEEAIENCNKLSQLNIEYCEEPLSENIPDHFEKLNEQTSLPIAIDETISQHSYWPNLLPYTKYLIIKPMVMGSFHKNIETKRLANTHNNKVVVTTSFESSVGRYFSGILAAGIGSSNTAHGLSTGYLLTDDVFQGDSFITNGYFRLSRKRLPTIDFNRQHIFSNLF